MQVFCVRRAPCPGIITADWVLDLDDLSAIMSQCSWPLKCELLCLPEIAKHLCAVRLRESAYTYEPRNIHE